MANHDLLTVQPSDKSNRRGQFSVMLLDCERLAWNADQIVAALDAGELTYEQLMYDMRVANNIGRIIPSHWNSLERFDSDRTSLLHYTDMHTQPWVSSDNPLESLWINGLRRAIAARFISEDEIQREIDYGHVRPSLRQRLNDSGLTRKQARQIDKNFIAPYRSLPTKKWRFSTVHQTINRLIRQIND